MSEERDKRLEEARREVAAWITMPLAGAPPPREEARIILRALERAEAENKALRVQIAIRDAGRFDPARVERMEQTNARLAEEVMAQSIELKVREARVKELEAAQREVCAARDEHFTNLQQVRAERDRLREALKSIAGNTCCDGCQEAARVAARALASEEESRAEEEVK